jgi:CHAD domain-containing protein
MATATLRDYRLQPDEPAPDGARRVARGQIDLARDELAGDGHKDIGDAVHEARKAFKRVRALVRLARDELGDEAYRRENETFRDAGRALSGVRDAAVLVATLDDVIARHGDELADGRFGALRDALADEAIEGVLVTLGRARDRVAGWPLPEDEDDVAILAPGFRRIYRRGRRALRAAEADTSTEHLHELRKRAKDLWHAAQVVRPAAPRKLKKLGRRAHRLSDVVGEDHDLAVLLDAARQRPHTLASGELELLETLVGRRRAQLQSAALKRGRKVYARKPRKLAKLIRGVPSR